MITLFRNGRSILTPITVLYTSADASLQSGAFRSLLYMSNGVQEKGIRSLLITPIEERDATEKLISETQEVCFLQLPQIKRSKSAIYYLYYAKHTFFAIKHLLQIIRKEKVDIIHVNEVLDFYAAVAAKLAGIPCIWHVRANFRANSLLNRLVPRIVNYLATRIVVVSNSVQEHMFVSQGLNSEKIRVLYNPGPSPNEFHPSVDGKKIREEFNLVEKQPLIVLVAKLIKEKGHETFICSVPEVVAHFPDAKFMIVGGELSGDRHQIYARKLRELPGELGVEKSVMFTGFRSDVAQIMAAADIVVHCSTFPDPFPGVVLQGMASGKAVISTNLGGTKEQIEDNVSGILIKSEDPRLLAQTIKKLLANEERRHSLGEAAVCKIQKQFTSEQFFSQLVEIYEELSAK